MSSATDRTPRLSVVIPAYHSHATIADCLEALRRQTFSDFETIVINSSPEPQTAAIVHEQFPAVVFEQSPCRLLPHAGRNRGVEISRGRLIVFTDPDCVAAQNWLETLIRTANLGHGIVVGAMGLLHDSLYESAVHLCKFSSWLPESPCGPRTIAPTANVLYRREVWEAIGPFRGESFSSDTVHSWHAARQGFVPWFEPRAIVFHRHGGDARSFLRERRLRGADFARIRIVEENRSRAWVAWHLAASPLVPWLELARVGWRTCRGRWTRWFVETAPLQLAANAAWAWGESRTYFQTLSARRTDSRSR